MSIAIEGKWKDSPLRLQPRGFAADVRNMIINKALGCYTAEPGFDLWSTYLFDNGLLPVGITAVNYNKKLVLSVTEDNLSEIGIFNANGSYTQILKEDLGFNINYPMDIEFEYNYKGELVVAFTDNNQTPKIINIDSPPSPFNLAKIELFPSSLEVKVDSEVIENGGNLLSGAYYPIFKYINNDFSESGWSEVSNPVYITDDNVSTQFAQYDGCPAGTVTSKGISLNLNNVDANYDNIILGVIFKNNGVYTVYQLGQYQVNGSSLSLNLVDITSASIIQLTSILTAAGFYTKIRHLTQTNGVLYAADLEEADTVVLQQWTNLISLKYQTTITDPLVLLSSYKVNDQNNKKKGFMHEEVYAFYIRFKLLKGGWTTAFHIPGRVAGTAEGKTWVENANISDIYSFDTSLQVDLDIDAQCKYFQTRDTSKNLNTGTGIGDFGYWENQDEVYPNTADYNSSGIGGLDLRGQKVRHHRFPTIRKLQNEMYSGNSNYGITQLDVLGVVIDSFPTLPDGILSLIEGYELLYAKRNSSNSTVAGQDLVICGGTRAADIGALNTRTSYSSSGNWANSDISSSTRASEFINVNGFYFRFHSFDLLLNKPAVGVSYISNQLKLNKTPPDGYFAHGTQQWSPLIDYTNIGTVCSPLAFADELLFSIKNFKYIPNNVISGKVNNLNCEECAWAELSYGSNRLSFGTNEMDFGNTNLSLDKEETYYTNLMIYKRNIYDSFYTQQLASTGTYFLIDDSIINIPIYGGDIFISKYGFTTYGPRILADIPGNAHPWAGAIDFIGWGVKVVRAFLCESYNNIGLRHEVLGNDYTRYFPKEDSTTGHAWFIDLGFDIRQNWNQIAYNTDYSSVNDLNPAIPYNTFTQFINKHPNRIIRCIPSPNEARAISWRNFLANDYFELQKNRGVITNIQGTSENYILINTEFSLFKTVGTEELQTDEFKVVLGSGDIFARPPSESEDDTFGYSGCQNKYSCLLTSFGYFFVDAQKKKVFMTGKGLEAREITVGHKNFFEDNCLNEGDNPYNNLGYTVTWDEKYRRIILSQVGTTKPFTMSYSPEKGTWTSDHDYIPSMLFNYRDSVFSLLDGKVYQHNSLTKVGIYYNPAIIFPSYITQIFNSARPEYQYSKEYKPDSINKKQELFFNIMWKTDIILSGAKQRELTLNKILIWNSYQCSGEIDISTFDQTKTLDQNFGVANARKIKDIWMFNKLRDLVIDNTVPFVIDSVIQDGNIDESRSYELKKRFSDDFLAVKFLFSNEKISTLQASCNLIDCAVNYNPVNR